MPKPMMNSRSKWNCPVFQTVYRITSIALFIHITSAEIINQPQSRSIENKVVQSEAVLRTPTHEYAHRHKRGSPSPASSPNSNSLLIELQKQISNLNTRTSSLPVQYKKIDALESTINDLSKKLDILNTSLTVLYKPNRKISGLESTINDLSQKLYNFRDGYLQNDKENKENIKNLEQKLEASTNLGIVQRIIAHQFSVADQRIQKLTNANDAIYGKIVQDVYSDQAGKLDLLLNFGGSITNLERKFKVYQALYNVVTAKKPTDIQKLLQLSQSIRNLEDKSRSFIIKLWKENKEATNNLISKAFSENGSGYWPTIKQVNEEIRRSLGVDYLVNVHYELFNDAWNRQKDFGKALHVTHKITNPEEQIIIHEKLYSLFKNNENYGSSHWVTLAGFMKATWEDPARNSNANLQSRYQSIINKLPSSLKNIVLHSSVCLKFSHFDEYLYAEDSSEERVFSNYRSVFTWIPKDNKYKSPEFKWKLSYKSDHQKWEILNAKYNESLRLRHHTNDKNETWYPVLIPTATDAIWKLYVDGDSVQISLNSNNFYLHPDGKRNDNRRYVIAYNHTSKLSYPLNWDIIDC